MMGASWDASLATRRALATVVRLVAFFAQMVPTGNRRHPWEPLRERQDQEGVGKGSNTTDHASMPVDQTDAAVATHQGKPIAHGHKGIASDPLGS